MDSKIYQTVKEEFSQKRRKAQQDADERRYEIYSKLPAVQQYDSEMLYNARTLVGAGEKAYEKLKLIEELTLKREKLLVSNGYPADYTNPRYECPECNDTGYSRAQMCRCMKRRIRLEALKRSGLGRLAESQSFDNFSLDYYSPYNRPIAERALNELKTFSEDFSAASSDNFLLIGGTGLGKTHLSTAVAKTVIDRGYDVVYTTVINMLDDFEKKRFSPYSVDNEHLTDRYFDCDLLIIDDLGCEMGTQFTISAMYNLINTRLNDGKCIIINTNLSPEEFQKKYEQRITSRILGNSVVIMLKGDDIRLKKLASR